MADFNPQPLSAGLRKVTVPSLPPVEPPSTALQLWAGQGQMLTSRRSGHLLCFQGSCPSLCHSLH
jgi:hypothetical protein